MTMTYQEFTQYTEMIMYTMSEMKRAEGSESIEQAALINKLVEKMNLDMNQNRQEVSVALAADQSRRYTKVIDQLIKKEGVLIVTQDSKNKAERFLSLNINEEN